VTLLLPLFFDKIFQGMKIIDKRSKGKRLLVVMHSKISIDLQRIYLFNKKVSKLAYLKKASTLIKPFM
jgi:hypothetical protein